MAKFGVGQSPTRLEDQRFLTGQGTYTSDINLDGQAYGIVVRSTYAHARIAGIDTSAATAAPGALAVYTAADIKAVGLKPLPFLKIFDKNIDGSKVFSPTREILAVDVVRHVGYPVAFVVAETLRQAQDAAELVDIDYEPLPSITDTKHASDADAAQVWDGAPNNIAFTWQIGNREATDAAFEKADQVVEVELVNNRLVANSMETRAAIGDWDGKRYTLHSPTQGVHFTQNTLSNVLGIEKDELRVVTPDVGGSFGMKNKTYPEPPLVLFAARDLNRPVKWTSERRSRVAERRLHGSRCPCRGHQRLYTHSPDGLLSRRRTAAPIYLVERLVDAATRQLKIDPAELRRRNLIPREAMPYAAAIVNVFDDGDFPRMMEAALKHADYEGFSARRESSRDAGKLRGFGFACYIENCGSGNEKAAVNVDEKGDVKIIIGTQAIGQGIATGYAQVIAEQLGVDNDRVTTIQGDTDLVATGNGTGGSKSMSVGGVACERAALALIENGKRIAAEELEASAADIEFADGIFSVVGTDRRAGLAQVAEAAADPKFAAEGEEAGLSGVGEFGTETYTFPNGCYVCEVEIDRDTGALDIVRFVAFDDIGTVVNPLLAGGQVTGGIIQGIGQAVHEGCIYDSESGQLLTGSYMDYRMPRADDVPAVDLNFIDDIPCKTNPLGVKGAGEIGTIGAPPTVVNAVLDALSEFNVSAIDMPVTPEKLWHLMNGNAQTAAN